MIASISLIRRKPGWGAEAFQDQWREHCATLVSKLPGLVDCDYDFVLDRVERIGASAEDTEEVDVFLRLRFESDAAWQDYVNADAGKSARAAAAHFVGEQRIAVVDQREVIALPAGGAAFKRMSLIQRRPELSLEQFLYEWREVHTGMVKAMPRVLGYRQSAIVERQSPVGTAVGYGGFPFDGIVELWFDSAEGMAVAFGSEAGQAAVAHVHRTVADMQAFGVGAK